MATTLERITKLMIEDLGLPHDVIGAETLFADDLGVDQTDAVQLLLSIEEEFEISLADDALDTAKSVGALATHVDKLVAAK